jgi:hypothetical protein
MQRRTNIMRFSTWFYLSFLFISIPCISFGNDEIVTIYYDPLGIGNLGLTSQFQLNRAGHNFDLNSVEWIIDDTIRVVNGSDFWTAYSNSGVNLCITGVTAQKKFATGIHSVKVTVSYDDSTITKAWKFDFRRVEYKMFSAKIAKDKSKSETQNYYYNLVSATPMDTSVFCCTCTESDTFIKYDTAGICYQFRCDVNQIYKYDRDTMSCFVLQQLPDPGVCGVSLISQPVENYLSVSTSYPDTLKFPFQLDTAIGIFNIHIDKNSIRKAYISISGPLKLGPLLNLGHGDPGWKLKATYDDKFWYIHHYIGSGDCPCGCTEWTSNSYTISQCGILYNAVVNPLQNQVNHSTGQTGMLTYDLLGRLISLKQKSGIANGLIIENSNGLRVSRVKIRK